MKPRVVSALLLSLLVVGAAVLGLTLSGSTGPSGLNGGQGGQTTTASGKGSGSPATLVVRARGVGQQFLYSAGTFGLIVPTMFVPLRGLAVTVTREVPPEVSVRDRPRPQNFKTNGSGIAEVKAPSGDYSVLVVGLGFSLNTTVALRANLTTTLDMSLIPSFASVSSLQVVGGDSSSAVEPTATIYVNVDSGVKAAPGGFYEVMGKVSTNAFSLSNATISNYASLNATAAGKYGSPGGTWVVLEPIGAYQTYPNADVLLVQFAPTYTVSYGAG